MKYRPLGRSGVLVSPICLGTLNFGGSTPKDEAFRIIDRALDAGINFIDTANVYNAGEAERIVGEKLKRDGQRDRVVLTTKVFGRVGPGPNDERSSRYHILKACDESLRRLQTDHVDLYQLHRPAFDIPQEETIGALDDLVRQGKILYFGTSTYPAWLLMEGFAISDRLHLARFTSEQPPYNLLDRRSENELIPLAQRYGLAVLPWSPLGLGILAGRYPKGEGAPPESQVGRAAGKGPLAGRITPAAQDVAGHLAQRAQERGMTAAQLALLWVKEQPGVTAPILGPRTMEHLEQALPVLNMELSAEDRAFCDTLVHPGNAVADFHSTSGWMKMAV